MQKFEYASPTTKEQAVALLGASWGEAGSPRRGDRPALPDEGFHRHAEARGQHQEHQGTRRHRRRAAARPRSARS